MPARVPNATGNWSTASNWLTASNTMTIHASTTLGISTTSRNTTLFTAPNTTNQCVGVALYLSARTAATAITVALQENNVDVVSRTFDAADVPLNCEGWYFFPLSTPYQYTTTNALSYRFRVATNSATASTTLRADSSGVNLALIAIDDRTGAVGVADDVYVLANVGSTAKTITFDQNDSGITCLTLNVGYNATLAFSTAMTTQMIVGNGSTVVNLGNVFPGGTLSIGTIANPIPSAYTATLQLDGSGTAANNTFYLFSGTSTSPSAASLSLVGSPTFNAQTKTLNGYTTGTYHTTTAVDASANATTLVLTDDIGLRTGGGDTIGIGEFDNNGSFSANVETKTTTAYNPVTRTVTLSSGIAQAKLAGCLINTLNRNVTIKNVNANRTTQLVALATWTYQPTTITFRETCFDGLNRIGGNGQNSYYTVFQGADIVGCSLINAGNGFLNLYGNRLINCHAYRTPWMTNCFNAAAAETNKVDLQVIGSTNIGSNQAPLTSCLGVTVSDCWFSCSYPLYNCSSCKVSNSKILDAAFLTYFGADNELSNLTVTGLDSVLREGQRMVFDNVLFTKAYSYIINNGGGGSQTSDHVFRNCVFTNTPAVRLTVLVAASSTVAGPRLAYFQNCSMPTMPKHFTLHTGGQTRYYTTATTPQTVFPVPSGALVANRIEQINTLIAANPVTTTFRIPVPNAAQNNTVTIPVYLNGWGASLPSNTELYVELFAPGATVPIVSTTTVTANDQWQYLTVSGVSTGQGHLIARVVLKKYVANAVLYVDWPLGMSTTNLDWYDGRPNEYLTPLSTYTAGQDLKSLRIDGPGMQEFKIPVASRLTTLTIKARYDSAHGTTAKPRALILAQPNLGISQQTATMTAGADTWETLTLRCTPAQAGTITLRLESRAASPWGRAWFDSFTAE